MPATRGFPGWASLSETESAYNLVRVGELKRPFADMPAGARLLLLNEGSGVQSVWRSDGNLGGASGISSWPPHTSAPFHQRHEDSASSAWPEARSHMPGAMRIQAPCRSMGSSWTRSLSTPVAST